MAEYFSKISHRSEYIRVFDDPNKVVFVDLPIPIREKEEDSDEYEEDSDEDEEDPRSDLTNDYHINRTSDYILEKEDDGVDREFEINTTEAESWVVNNFNISNSLSEFKEMSMKIPPKNLSDIRLLALNYICMFTLDQENSVTKYFNVYEDDDEYGDKAELTLAQINKELNVDESNVPLSSNISTWADELSKQSTTTTNWFDIQALTLDFMNKAFKINNKEEIIAANILHRMALNYCNRLPDNKLEDSFAHSAIASIFESVFLLSYQWANGYMNESSRYKPDYIVFLSHSQDRYDLAITELKPPSNKSSTNNAETDLVKIGKEMQFMINNLIKRGVSCPVVCGVMLKGFNMKTYKMDLPFPHTYRMIELSSVTVCQNLQGITVLPTVLRSMLQIKNIVKKRL